MPYLLCQTHGEEHEASCQEEQETYRQLGETVVIVSGTLISGPWKCDRCGAALKKGTMAHLLTAYPRHFADELTDYDYGNEQRYFKVEKAAVNIYGAMPPGGIAVPAMQEENH